MPALRRQRIIKVILGEASLGYSRPCSRKGQRRHEQLRILLFLSQLESRSQHPHQVALTSPSPLGHLTPSFRLPWGTCLHTSLQTHIQENEQQTLKFNILGGQATCCRECLNKNKSHFSRLNLQDKASEAQSRSVSHGLGTEKNPGDSRLAKGWRHHFFFFKQYSHRTLAAISNFIEKFNEQVIVISNPFSH